MQRRKVILGALGLGGAGALYLWGRGMMGSGGMGAMMGDQSRALENKTSGSAQTAAKPSAFFNPLKTPKRSGEKCVAACAITI